MNVNDQSLKTQSLRMKDNRKLVTSQQEHDMVKLQSTHSNEDSASLAHARQSKFTPATSKKGGNVILNEQQH